MSNKKELDAILEDLYQEAAEEEDTTIDDYIWLVEEAFLNLRLKEGQTYYTVAGLDMPYRTKERAIQAAKQDADDNASGFAQVRQHVAFNEDIGKLVGYVHADNSKLADSKEIAHLKLD